MSTHRTMTTLRAIQLGTSHRAPRSHPARMLLALCALLAAPLVLGQGATPRAPAMDEVRPDQERYAIPPQGVPLKVRRGFFTEVDVGTFFTLGGDDHYSNPQTYLQIGVGYDIARTLSLGLHVGLGASAFNCFSGRSGGICPETEAFTATFLDLSAAYLHSLGSRFYLTPQIVGGYTWLDPAPVRSASGLVYEGVNVGAGVGLEYATSMDHFTVGVDLVGRYILSANIPAVSVFPRVKYTF